MSQKVIEFTCPGCGNRVTTNDTVCDFCGGPITISTFNSVYSMPMPEVNKYVRTYNKIVDENPDDARFLNSVGICYFKLGLYDKALSSFEKLIEENFDNSEIFFYSAICLLHGKKAFLTQRPTINKILEYMDAAIMIEPKGIYYYFLAYIKLDYFKRKHLNVSPNYLDMLDMANQAGLSEYDIEQLYELLKVERPSSI